MDIKSAAQTIRDTVDMQQIMDLYGYTVRHGFMVCPFHGETDASLKVYKGTGGWHCFGCGRGGSVIDFVMEHEGCDFRTAVRAIDNALRLGLFPSNEDPFKLEDQRRFQEWLDKLADAFYAYCDEMTKLIEAVIRNDVKRMKAVRGKDTSDRTADECTFLLNFDGECQYNEYRLEKIAEFREEVAAWRRKARKVQSA